jgi:O-antigen/teichoic acid export membrane protein
MRSTTEGRTCFRARWFARNLLTKRAVPSALRDVGALGSGAFVSQIIFFLAAPLFLRLYEPSDFGLYSFTYSTIAVVATLSTWKTERLIVLARARATAIRLLVALLSIAASAALLLFVLLVAIYALARTLLIPAPAGLWLMWPAPLSMLLLVAATAVRLYSIRARQFRTVAVAQIVRALVFVAGITGSAVFWPGLGGHGAAVMLSWQIAADACGLLVQLYANRSTARLVILRPRIRRSLAVLMQHRRTLGALAVSEVLRTLNQQIPLATVTLAFGAVPAGWYSMATALVSGPTSVVALAVGDVTNQRLSRHYAAGNPISHLIIRTIGGMAAVGLIPFAAVSLLAPTVLPLLMGPQWSDASHTVAIFAIASYLWFVTEPATNIPLILHARRFIVLWPALRSANWVVIGTAAVCGLVSYNTWLVLTVAGSAVIYVLESTLGALIARSADKRLIQARSSGPLTAAELKLL